MDEQAKDDLRLLYDDIEPSNKSKREFFWDVLECAGIAEEFKLYMREE